MTILMGYKVIDNKVHSLAELTNEFLAASNSFKCVVEQLNPDRSAWVPLSEFSGLVVKTSLALIKSTVLKKVAEAEGQYRFIVSLDSITFAFSRDVHVNKKNKMTIGWCGRHVVSL